MRDRTEWYLKLACLVLAGLLVLRMAGMVRRARPMARASVPEPATWTPPASPTNPTEGRPSGPAAMPGMPPGMPPAMPGRPGMGPRGPGGGGPVLSAEAQARVDRVIQSELLGPIMRPPPMALIGIVGEDVLLRAPNGQSGLVREGGELGGVQVVRVGTNRVLVREQGELKELMIFNGMGGESLLPTEKEKTP